VTTLDPFFDLPQPRYARPFQQVHAAAALRNNSLRIGSILHKRRSLAGTFTPQSTTSSAFLYTELTAGTSVLYFIKPFVSVISEGGFCFTANIFPPNSKKINSVCPSTTPEWGQENEVRSFSLSTSKKLCQSMVLFLLKLSVTYV